MVLGGFVNMNRGLGGATPHGIHIALPKERWKVERSPNVAVKYKRFTSAHDAFMTLDASRLEKRLIASKCKRLLKILPEMVRVNDKYWVSEDPPSLLWELFMNRMQTQLLTKSIRLLQPNQSKKICVFGCPPKSHLAS